MEGIIRHDVTDLMETRSCGAFQAIVNMLAFILSEMECLERKFEKKSDILTVTLGKNRPQQGKDVAER